MAKKNDSSKTTVSVKSDQHKRIKQIAEKEGKLVERVVQEVIEEGLKEVEKKKDS